MSSISVVPLGHGETKRFIFLGDCHGSLLGTPNLTKAHLIANHLIVARLIGTHLAVIHLIANHLVASHRIVTIATMPQVSDFSDRCTNLWSGKREGHVTCIEIVLLVHPNFFILSNWQLKKTYGKHSLGHPPVASISYGIWKLRKSPVCSPVFSIKHFSAVFLSNQPPSNPSKIPSYRNDTWLVMKFPCWQFSHSSKTCLKKHSY